MPKQDFDYAGEPRPIKLFPLSLDEALTELERLSSSDPNWQIAEQDPMERLTRCLTREEKRAVYNKAFKLIGITLPLHSQDIKPPTQG